MYFNRSYIVLQFKIFSLLTCVLVATYVSGEYVLRLVSDYKRQNGETISLVKVSLKNGISSARTNVQEFHRFREAEKGTSHVATMFRSDVSLQEQDADPVRLSLCEVSSEYFQTLGASFLIGHGFLQNDENSDSDSVVLSYKIWKDNLSQAHKQLDSSISLDGRAFRVIGVLGPQFGDPFGGQIYHCANLNNPFISRPSFRQFSLILSPYSKALTKQSVAIFDAISRELSGESPLILKYQLVDLFDIAQGTRSRNIFVGLLIASGFLFLVFCYAVSSYAIVDILARSRTIATQVSLGAGAWIPMGRWLAIVFGCPLVATAAGILISKFFFRKLSEFLPPELMFRAPTKPSVIIIFSGLILSLLAMIPGLLIYAKGVRNIVKRPIDALKSGRLSVSGGAMLIFPSIFFLGSCLLIVIASTLQTLYIHGNDFINANPGWRSDKYRFAELVLPFDSVSDPEKCVSFVKSLDEIYASNEVMSAGVMSTTPFSHISSVRIDAEHAKIDHANAIVQSITPKTEKIYGLKLIRGRLLNETDDVASEPVVLIARRLALDFFPSVDEAIGRNLTFTYYRRTATRRIVGVVDDLNQTGSTDDAGQDVFVSYFQLPISEISYAIASKNGENAIPAFRSFLQKTRSNVRLVAITTTREQRIAGLRMFIAIVSAISLVAVVMCATVVFAFATLANAFVQRKLLDISIRQALGSPTHLLLRATFGVPLFAAVLGAIFGLGVSIFTSSYISTGLGIFSKSSAVQPILLSAASSVLWMVFLIFFLIKQLYSVPLNEAMKRL